MPKKRLDHKKKPELRQDVVSGDWILIAPGRKRRPSDIFEKIPKRKAAPIRGCPFEDLQKSGHEEPLLLLKDHSAWEVQVIPNKFPAVTHSDVCPVPVPDGPYSMMWASGHHELVVTRDHNKNFAHLGSDVAVMVFQAFRYRYRALAHDSCMEYMSIFHNWGPAAGASIYHPHYQMIGIPVLPPDVSHSLQGSSRYFKENRKCVHCEIIKWEQGYRKRIVYENEHVIAFVPFAPRASFEMRIFPKNHSPYFEDTDDEKMAHIVSALQLVLQKVEHRLRDADYNFFIHTAPMKDRHKFSHYHWHIEIVPKFSISAGFELSTGIEITVVDPDEAALHLK